MLGLGSGLWMGQNWVGTLREWGKARVPGRGTFETRPFSDLGPWLQGLLGMA